MKLEFDNIHLNSVHKMEKPVSIKCHTGGTWKVEFSKSLSFRRDRII